MREETNAKQVGAAETKYSRAAAGSGGSRAASLSRRGHAATTPREDCTRSIAGAVAGFVFPDVFVRVRSFVFVPAPSAPATLEAPAAPDGVQGAIRSSVSRPRRATPPGALGDAAHATTRRGFSVVVFGQNGNAWPTATHPTCLSAFVSISFATARIASQSRSVSGFNSTNAAIGALGRPATRTGSPSLSPRQSASASGISIAPSQPLTAPAHAANGGAFSAEFGTRPFERGRDARGASASGSGTRYAVRASASATARGNATKHVRSFTHRMMSSSPLPPDDASTAALSIRLSPASIGSMYYRRFVF